MTGVQTCALPICFPVTITGMLDSICKNFMHEFGLTKEQYMLEVEAFDGTLEELYIHIQRKYPTLTTKVERRGRPKKQTI